VQDRDRDEAMRGPTGAAASKRLQNVAPVPALVLCCGLTL
jgi:hypothetical protein